MQLVADFGEEPLHELQKRHRGLVKLTRPELLFRISEYEFYVLTLY